MLDRLDQAGPVVELRLSPEVRWVVDQYPTLAVTDEPDGTTVVRLRVTATAWLERLLLRLGHAAEVVDFDGGDAAALRGDAARRVLARYR